MIKCELQIIIAVNILLFVYNSATTRRFPHALNILHYLINAIIFLDYSLLVSHTKLTAISRSFYLRPKFINNQLRRRVCGLSYVMYIYTLVITAYTVLLRSSRRAATIRGLCSRGGRGLLPDTRHSRSHLERVTLGLIPRRSQRRDLDCYYSYGSDGQLHQYRTEYIMVYQLKIIFLVSFFSLMICNIIITTKKIQKYNTKILNKIC